jgi:hypothetical protein
MKTQNQYTPGPWILSQFKASEDTHRWSVIARASDDNRLVDVCTCYPISDDGQEGAECHANAQLIAAAPLLVEALENLLSEFESRTALIETCDMDDDELASMDAARAALAKAKGEL